MVLAGRIDLKHHGANTSDEGRGRAGDFDVGDVAIHVTSAPGDALLAKCAANLRAGTRPMIVTNRRGAAVAHGLAEQHGIADRVEVVEIEQFVSTNAHELGAFSAAGAAAGLEAIVSRYNELIDAHQNDPGLKIEIGARGKAKG